MAKNRRTLAGASLTLQEIEPLTQNQLLAFDSDKPLLLHGVAGTGKTFISCYLAFDDMIKGYYNNLVILRSAVPTRDIGFLPGNEKEKSAIYEAPYKDIAVELFSRGDAYEILKQKSMILGYNHRKEMVDKGCDPIRAPSYFVSGGSNDRLIIVSMKDILY